MTYLFEGATVSVGTLRIDTLPATFAGPRVLLQMKEIEKKKKE
jgi:hypothetical protein